MRRKLSGLGLALLLAGGLACSEDPSKKEKSDFFRKMEQESEEFARRKVKERKEQEARQKQQTEAYYKRLEEEAVRASQAAAAPPAAASPAAPAGDVQYVLSDKDLTFLVLNKIRLLQHRSTVSVECKDGVVKLFGETESAEMKQRLVAELKKLPGVQRVDASELYPAAK
jgi:osmotically-inducible protein OsmY